MSGSESDLDFESADEDSEFVAKACDSKHDECTPSKNSGYVCGNVNDEQFLKNNCSQQGSSTNLTNEEDISKLESQNVCSEIVNTCNTQYETSSEIDSNTKAVMDVANTKKEEIITDNRKEDQINKQRIPLRIEKKKQHEIRKEQSPVRETKSDLVNILEDSHSEKFSSWGFSRWGTSLLSTAASSVSSFSSQVTQGIGTVLETVESTLGAPSPEELATTLKENRSKQTHNSDEEIAKVQSHDESGVKSGLLFDVSSLTKVLENTGSKVLMGGLDTLELIGKKSIDILTVGDPGLRKKRSAFGDGTSLTEILKEAKAKADEQDSFAAEDSVTVHYSRVFDDKQGLVHLEALEMLSRQSQVKIQRLLMRHSKNVEVKKQFEEIRTICENISSFDDSADFESFEEFEFIFKKHALGLNLSLNLDNIIQTQRKINLILKEYESEEYQEPVKDIYHCAITCLAEFTAKCIEAFHKVAEIILVNPPLTMEMENCAINLTGLATVMCIETNNLSMRFHKHLDRICENTTQDDINNKNESINGLVTNLYVEAANSNKYIQDAYQMLIPVLQESLLEHLE